MSASVASMKKWGIPSSKMKSPEMTLLERLVWVKYKSHWWPALLYHSYTELQEHLYDQLDMALKAQFAMAIMRQMQETKKMKVARLLGRKILEVLEVEEGTYFEFYWQLPRVLPTACKPSQYGGDLDLYFDFHQALDQVENIIREVSQSSFGLMPGSDKTSWIERAHATIEESSGIVSASALSKPRDITIKKSDELPRPEITMKPSNVSQESRGNSTIATDDVGAWNTMLVSKSFESKPSSQKNSIKSAKSKGTPKIPPSYSAPPSDVKKTPAQEQDKSDELSRAKSFKAPRGTTADIRRSESKSSSKGSVREQVEQQQLESSKPDRAEAEAKSSASVVSRASSYRSKKSRSSARSHQSNSKRSITSQRSASKKLEPSDTPDLCDIIRSSSRASSHSKKSTFSKKSPIQYGDPSVKSGNASSKTSGSFKSKSTTVVNNLTSKKQQQSRNEPMQPQHQQSQAPSSSLIEARDPPSESPTRVEMNPPISTSRSRDPVNILPGLEGDDIMPGLSEKVENARDIWVNVMNQMAEDPSGLKHGDGREVYPSIIDDPLANELSPEEEMAMQAAAEKRSFCLCGAF